MINADTYLTVDWVICSKVTTVKQFEQQHYGKHDEVNLEYDELWIVPTIILLDLERHYKEKYNAKAVLTEIFVVS